MLTKSLREYIIGGGYDAKFALLYGEDCVLAARERYCEAIGEFTALYGDGDVQLFSVPGRSEILGNHTDHNHGRVIAASINLDIIAVVAASAGTVVRVKSAGFPADCVDVSDTEVKQAELQSSAAVIRGVCAEMALRGYKAGGFDAYTTSDVLKGSGLSSSAAFEVLIGKIESCLYNGDVISAIELAQIGQRAENVYFGKPCGLMDQTACASGGFVTIDFADPSKPVVEKLSFDLYANGINLCITDTGGNHADLTEDYASIPEDMKKIAAHFGQETLRGIELAQLWARAAELRAECGDKAFLRAVHFAGENQRVFEAAQSIRERDLAGFLGYITASGNSSSKYLQNVYTIKAPDEQGLSVALAASEGYLADKNGACRLHGGGFAGTIQAFVERQHVAEYAQLMDSIFGAGACHVLFVREDGAAAL